MKGHGNLKILKKFEVRKGVKNNENIRKSISCL